MSQQETTLIALVKFKRDCLYWGVPQLALRKYFMNNIPGLLFCKVLEKIGEALEKMSAHDVAAAEEEASDFL